MHILGAIGCLVLALVMASVVFLDHDPLPDWVNALATVTMGIMIVTAARIYVLGARRKRETEGPRTRIVIADVPPPPSRKRPAGKEE